jgi:hypothetical protein
MQALKERSRSGRLKLTAWVLLLLFPLLIQYSKAEVIAVNNDYVMMTTENLRLFLNDSEELRILKEQQIPSKKIQYYAGVNGGTYGVGVHAGILF